MCFKFTWTMKFISTVSTMKFTYITHIVRRHYQKTCKLFPVFFYDNSTRKLDIMKTMKNITLVSIHPKNVYFFVLQYEHNEIYHCMKYEYKNNDT